MAVAQVTFCVTLECTARCGICITDARPDRRERLGDEELLRFVSQATDVPTVKVVAFSGGEALLCREPLERAVRAVRRAQRLPKVVTNAFWASSRARAASVLSPYARAGLWELWISADSHHRAFVPDSHVANAVSAAMDLGIWCTLVRVCGAGEPEPWSRYVARFGISPHSALHINSAFNAESWQLFQAQRMAGITAHRHEVLILDNELVPAGRAASRANECVLSEVHSMPLLACATVGRQLYVDTGANVFPCCTPVRNDAHFSLGNLRAESLAAVIARAEAHPLLTYLRTFGPAHLLREIDAGTSIRPRQLAGMCHACSVARAPDGWHLAQALCAARTLHAQTLSLIEQFSRSSVP